MRKHAFKLATLIAVALAMTLSGPSRAAADDDDPPTRVARLSVADGSVSFQPAGTEDWVTAVVNRPMTTGDKLWADRDSRAELQIGSGSIRLGANTGFSFLNLDDNTAQLQLTEGTVRVRLRRLNRGEIFEVDTPNLAFTASRPGIYRINVNEAGDTTVVVVRDGEGEVTGGGQSYTVHDDETGIFSGTDQLNADIEGVGTEDDLERWSYERDRREDHSASRRYVSEDAVGYQDLDEYGGWRNTPDYGTVWFPHTTVVGWAPYRYGHWVWIAPWGYTWVDDEPWGFAPFHYGRWVAVGGVWGWVPCRPASVGVVYVRPVYAPALVAWVGGPHVAIGVAVGGGEAVGWFPLGPREVYVPSYRVSRRYVNNVNVTNTTVNTTVVNNYYNTVVVNKTTVNNVAYVNQRVPGAVTATSRQAFSTSQPVARNVVRVDERQIARAQVNMGAPAVAPERQAFVGSGRPAQARPPERFANRAVVAKTAPPPPPAPIDRQQALIRQNGGQPPAASQVRTAEAQQARPAATVRMAPPSRPTNPQERNTGNREAPPQNVNRPVQQQSNVQPNNRPGTPPPNNERPSNNAQPNRPANNERPNAERPNTPPPGNAPPNAQPNRPPANERPNNERNDRPPSARPANPNAERPNTSPNAQPNRPPNNDRPNAERPNTPPNAERPNTPPPNAQPNPPANNNRPSNNERNDRPPSARPANPPANGNPQVEQQHRQELDNLHRQQDQERQRVEQQQTQERQRANQQRADDQRRQQMQDQQQRQLQDMQRKHEEEQQRVQQRQEQEHRQAPPPPQRPAQAERPQQRPPQAERQQPPPRQQQQDRSKQQEKPKEKDKPPKG